MRLLFRLAIWLVVAALRLTHFVQASSYAVDADSTHRHPTFDLNLEPEPEDTFICKGHNNGGTGSATDRASDSHEDPVGYYKSVSYMSLAMQGRTVLPTLINNRSGVTR